jgi:AcrR family transcriptional regulator
MIFVSYQIRAREENSTVSTQVKTKPDDTRARIIETADALFRRLGYAKTAVADIAAELGMSPANVYRFFPSKNAIVEAICRRCLSQLDENAWAVARSRGPAAARLERLVLEILNYHKDNLLTDKRVNDIVLIAIEDSWDAIEKHKEVIRNVVELILRDGIEAGEFEPVDPPETARLMMRSLVAYMHPVLISQCLSLEEDIEAEARASVRFLLRAIAPRS